MSSEKAEETLLLRTIHYAKPRIEFCVESLRHELSREAQVPPSGPSRKRNVDAAVAAVRLPRSSKSWRDETWREYDFGVGGSEKNDQGCALDEIDRLSRQTLKETNEEEMRDVTLLFQKVLDFCKAMKPPDEEG